MATPSEDRLERFRKGKVDSTSEDPPSPQYLNWLHSLVPYRTVNDLHHKIGTNSYDAAAGNHRHLWTDNSVLLFDGDDIPGDLSTLAGVGNAVRAIAEMLADRGATDSTTN